MGDNRILIPITNHRRGSNTNRNTSFSGVIRLKEGTSRRKSSCFRLFPTQMRHQSHQLRDGILLGFLLVTITCVCVSSLILLAGKSRPILHTLKRYISYQPPTKEEGLTPGRIVKYRGGLYVGVITSGRSIERAEALRTTWGKGASNLTFFSDDYSMKAIGTSPLMHLIRLPVNVKAGSDTLKMLQVVGHICKSTYDSDWGRFDWFLLSRDDVYINIYSIAGLIRTLDPSDKIQAGIPSNMPVTNPEISVCSSAPMLLLSRTLLQESCGFLDQCQTKGNQSDPQLTFSSCLLKYSRVPCSPLTQGSFHRLKYEEIKSLVVAEPGHMTEIGERLHHVTVTYGVPQPWVMSQLHSFSLLVQFKDRGKLLDEQMEKKQTLETNLYNPYSGPSMAESVTSDAITTHQGDSFSSHTCGGSTSHHTNYTQLIEAAVLILQSTKSDISNLTLQQIYSANLANRTLASIVDLSISSNGKDPTASNQIHHLFRIALKMRQQSLKRTSQQVSDRLNRIWILLPITEIADLISYLKFWNQLRKTNMGIAITLLLLPINLSSAQLSRAIPKDGIYNSDGEIRKLISYPREFSTETEGYTEAFRYVCKWQQDTAIFMTSPHFRFRTDFINRCLAHASTGSQYFPIPYLKKSFQEFPWIRPIDSSQEDSTIENRNHTVWMDKQQFLKCFSSKLCSNLTAHIHDDITAVDPGLHLFLR